MKRHIHTITAILTFGFLTLNGQDLHFTNFDFAPQSISPALNGAFLGTYRVNAIFRDQYQNAGVNGFRTIEAAIDAPIIRGIRKQDWIGVGISIDRDSRGMFNLTDMQTRLGLAYHLSLDKKQTRILSFGAQRVGINRSMEIPAGAGITSVLLSGARTDADIEALRNRAAGGTQGGSPNISASFSDLSAGVTFTATSKTNKFVIGVSSMHFLRNNSALQLTYDIPLRITGFVTYDRMINKKMKIEPAILFQRMSIGTEVSAKAMLGYTVSPTNPLMIKGGLGVRTGTVSAQILAGAEYKNIRVGLAYDLPLSGYARAPGIQNALEMGVSYLGIINRTPKPKPIIVCPRL
jgi:type IX secretion system PorP/SprF family membrane protein